MAQRVTCPTGRNGYDERNRAYGFLCHGTLVLCAMHMVAISEIACKRVPSRAFPRPITINMWKFNKRSAVCEKLSVGVNANLTNPKIEKNASKTAIVFGVTRRGTSSNIKSILLTKTFSSQSLSGFQKL